MTNYYSIQLGFDQSCFDCGCSDLFILEKQCLLTQREKIHKMSSLTRNPNPSQNINHLNKDVLKKKKSLKEIDDKFLESSPLRYIHPHFIANKQPFAQQRSNYLFKAFKEDCNQQSQFFPNRKAERHYLSQQPNLIKMRSCQRIRQPLLNNSQNVYGNGKRQIKQAQNRSINKISFNYFPSNDYQLSPIKNDKIRIPHYEYFNQSEKIIPHQISPFKFIKAESERQSVHESKININNSASTAELSYVNKVHNQSKVVKKMTFDERLQNDLGGFDTKRSLVTQRHLLNSGQGCLQMPEKKAKYNNKNRLKKIDDVDQIKSMIDEKEESEEESIVLERLLDENNFNNPEREVRSATKPSSYKPNSYSIGKPYFQFKEPRLKSPGFSQIFNR